MIPHIRKTEPETDAALKLWYEMISSNGAELDSRQVKLAENHKSLFRMSPNGKYSLATRFGFKRLQSDLDWVSRRLQMIWTLEYAVTRKIFQRILLSITDIKKHLPGVLLSDRYASSLCVLLPEFVLDGESVRHLLPAPRFGPTTGSKKADFLSELCCLLNDGLEIQLLGELDDPFRDAFSTEKSIEYFLESQLPDFCLSEGKIYPRCRFFDFPAEEKIIEPVDMTKHIDPLKLLQFYILRIKATSRDSELMTFDDSFAGIPITWFTTQMDAFQMFDDNEGSSELFVRSYEGFRVCDDKVFPVSAESILSWHPMAFLVVVENIAKRIRNILKLTADPILRKPPLDTGDKKFWKEIVKMRPVELKPVADVVSQNCQSIPLSFIEVIIDQLPNSAMIRGIFPGRTLITDLPILSKLTAYSIHVENGNLFLI